MPPPHIADFGLREREVTSRWSSWRPPGRPRAVPLIGALGPGEEFAAGHVAQDPSLKFCALQARFDEVADGHQAK